MDTLLLDTITWDLILDASNNIAVAADPYSQAQDAASAIRTFTGDEYYNQSAGINYFKSILGQRPSLPLTKKTFADAALAVPGIAASNCFLTGFNPNSRLLQGQVQIVNAQNQKAVASF